MVVTEEKVAIVGKAVEDITIQCPACSEELTIPVTLTDGGLNEDGDHVLTLMPQMDEAHRHIKQRHIPLVLDLTQVYALPPGTGNQLDVVVDDLLVQVKRTDEGVIVDIFPNSDEESMGQPFGSTYAFFGEGEDR